MHILVDADACPVTALVVEAAGRHLIPVTLVCDSAHQLSCEGARVVQVDKSADSADFALVNLLKAGDIVVTQDYGLAAMALGRGARVLNHDGMAYTHQNIDGLLMQRHVARAYRRAGGRTRGPKPRQKHQDQAFLKALEEMLADHG